VPITAASANSIIVPKDIFRKTFTLACYAAAWGMFSSTGIQFLTLSYFLHDLSHRKVEGVPSKRNPNANNYKISESNFAIADKHVFREL